MKITNLIKQISMFCVLALLILLTASVSLVVADDSIQVVEQLVESKFRDHITAHLTVDGQTDIAQVEFFYRVVGQAATSRNVATFEPGSTVMAEHSIDQTDIYFPPGTEFEYWWKITDVDDNSLKTEKQTFLYLDDRYDFKTLGNDRVALYWYNGDDAFGQQLFEQANKGLDQLEKNVGVSVDQPVKIFIYGSHDDLLNAIAVGAQEWTGGQAFVEHGVVVMGVTPDNLNWGLKATTHELTHLIIHQATDNPYGDLPRWLDEGLAVYNEDPTRLDSQFRDSFQRAVDNDSLMTLQTLSSAFPADPDAANLAYGESGAVVKFIIDTYGTESMKTLLDIFSEGALYDDALEEALGVDTRGLDNAWRTHLGVSLLPDTVTVDPAADNSQSVEAETLAPTPDKSVMVPASDAQNETSASEKSNKTALPCATGLLPGVILGAVLINRRVLKKRI